MRGFRRRAERIVASALGKKRLARNARPDGASQGRPSTLQKKVNRLAPVVTEDAHADAFGAHEGQERPHARLQIPSGRCHLFLAV
jgi:hypothetical protein